MSKLKAFVLNNYQKLFFSFLINLFFFAVFNIFFYCRYHTVDDVFMEMIACGAYGSYDSHLIYINSVIGFFLKSLYSIINVIPWYGIMHLAMAICSFSFILYVFFNGRNNAAKFLCILLVFVVSYEAYTRVQFTKTSAYLAVAGYLLIANSLYSDNRVIKQVIGVCFILNSYMIRPGMFFACSAICLGLFVPVVYNFLIDKESDICKNIIKRLFIIGGCSLALLVTVFAIDKMAYSGEGWSYYKRFNEYTTQLQDINFPEYELYVKEYTELGIDYNDYVLYSSIDHNDPELFDMEKMEKVKDLQPHKTMNIDEFIVFLLRGYNKLFKEPTVIPFTIIFIYSFLLFIFAAKLEIKSLLSVFLSMFFTFIGLFYTYMMHRWLDRTTISLLLALTFVVLFYLKANTNKVLLCANTIVAVVLICVSLYSWNGFFKWNMGKWINNRKVNLAVMDEIYDDKDHLYISRIAFPAWKAYYAPYDLIKKGTLSNYSPLGDWLANNPLSVNALKEYGVVNMYRDVVDNDKTYLIGDSASLEPVLTYIREHYNSEADIFLVKNVGPYEVYSVKTPAVQ